jgi:multicomponent Na+:H+ antiporter subunit A
MRWPELLLAATFLIPFGMLLACLWPRLLRLMPSCLHFAPMPALAAVFLVPGNAAVNLGSPRLHLSFVLDLPGALLLGVAALLWITSGAYALPYLQGGRNQGHFAVFWLMALTGCIGVFLAADMVGFYFLLALLTVGGCGLVSNHETAHAWRAGATYIMVALLAESLLLIAFVMLAAESPNGSLLIRDAAAALPTSPHRDLILALLIGGFGIKAGLVPFHFWMPLAYRAAPTPASAVLSGAVVKASILGLIRFLPLDVALPNWGMALAATGLFAALYGVLVGITRRHPKVLLAYSSVSQMGFMIAVIGMGMIAGDHRAGLAAAFYASHHVLVKGALFLSAGVIVATGSRHMWSILLPAAIIAVGLGGLPLTGGGLAKIVVGGPLGNGTANTVATLSAIGTTLLMIQFLRSLKDQISEDQDAKADTRLVRSWLATAAASIIVPWMLFLVVPRGTLPDPFALANLWKAFFPVLLGVMLAVGLSLSGHWPRRTPEADVMVAMGRATRLVAAGAQSFERMDDVLRRWPSAGVSLLLLIAVFGAALFFR